MYSCSVLKKEKYVMADLLLLCILTITSFSHPLSLRWMFSLYKPPSCVSMLLHVSKLTLVVCRGGTMKSEEFLLSRTLPSCSNHPSSPEQPRARKSRQISRLINWHPAPFFFFYLLSSHCASQQFLKVIIMFASPYERKKPIFGSFFILYIVPSLIVHC